MLRLSRVIKPWKESAALNDHISLYGFWNQTAFLTKSGDLGMVLHVEGVDPQSGDALEAPKKPIAVAKPAESSTRSGEARA